TSPSFSKKAPRRAPKGKRSALSRPKRLSKPFHFCPFRTANLDLSRLYGRRSGQKLFFFPLPADAGRPRFENSEDKRRRLAEDPRASSGRRRGGRRSGCPRMRPTRWSPSGRRLKNRWNNLAT